MESQWIKDIKVALDAVGGDPVMPSIHASLAAILVAKGIVTAEELKEISDHFNKK